MMHMENYVIKSILSGLGFRFRVWWIETISESSIACRRKSIFRKPDVSESWDGREEGKRRIQKKYLRRPRFSQRRCWHPRSCRWERIRLVLLLGSHIAVVSHYLSSSLPPPRACRFLLASSGFSIVAKCHDASSRSSRSSSSARDKQQQQSCG